MNIQIEPIPFGIDKQSTSLTLDWGKKEIFSEDLTFVINFLDASGNLIYVKELPITLYEYLSKGDNKELRINNILAELGITRL